MTLASTLCGEPTTQALWIATQVVSDDPLGFVAGDTNLYRYVGNSPPNHTDPSGLIWGWAAAGIGAVLGAGTYLIGTAVTSVISGQNEFSWGGLAGAAAGGAVAGLVVGALTGDATSALGLVGIGAAAGAAGGATAGFVGSVVDQGVANVKKGNWNPPQWDFSWKQVGISTGVGLVAGAVGGAVTAGLLGPTATRNLASASFARLVGSGLGGGIAGGATGGALTALANDRDPVAGALSGAWRGGVFGGVGGVLTFGGARALKGIQQIREEAAETSGWVPRPPERTPRARTPTDAADLVREANARKLLEDIREMPADEPPGSVPLEFRSAKTRGTLLHLDKEGMLPDQLRQRYPDTQFEFKAPGQPGQDVKVVGGKHPSEYAGSKWPNGINYGDFKPDTPSGHKKFESDQRLLWEEETTMLPYDPHGGTLK
ncbi:MAG: hypothetical protein HYS12_23855 [Planctomycetes bacterium]|nr:hypothetical protein [Planctomycetota bacterium]